jgi:peptidoglycan/LPS O-acetylase OafA/YrhL
MSQDLLFVPFMFIGTVFSYHFRQKISVLQLLASAALLIGLFIACWTRSVLKEQFPIVPMNYFYALGLFTVAYCLRDRFRPIKPVDWLASISYPLYAVHSIVGYASVRFLTALGVSYYPALAATAVFVAVLAYIVHRTVETPTMHVGKRIAKHVPAGYLPNAAESKAG